MSSQAKQKVRDGRKRGISILLLLSLCAVFFPFSFHSASLQNLLPGASGIPSTPEKDRTAAFPCQDRPCGCRSAEQCWKKCCCFSNAQKLAWARKNQVDVPEFVVAAAAAERAPMLNASQPHNARSYASCCRKSKEVDTSAGESSRNRRVIALNVWQCNGLSVLFATLSLAMLPSAASPEQLATPSRELIETPCSLLPEQVGAPPEPPPRLFA